MKEAKIPSSKTQEIYAYTNLNFIRCVRGRIVILKDLDLSWSQNILDIRFSAFFDENERRSSTLRYGIRNYLRTLQA